MGFHVHGPGGIGFKKGRHNYLSGTPPFQCTLSLRIVYVSARPSFCLPGNSSRHSLRALQGPSSKRVFCQLGYGPIAVHTMSRKRAADGSMVMGEHSKKMETKYASLKEDYKELQRDTRALKKRVKRATLKKNNLLAEVRFLRRKYKMLKGQGSDQLVALVGTYKGSPHACSIENGIKSPREATSTEEEHVTCECTGLESSLPSDDSYATEINGSQPLAMRGIPEVSSSQKLSITPHVECAKKKARVVCNGLVSALKSSRVKDDQIKLIPPTVAGRRTISWEDEFW